MVNKEFKQAVNTKRFNELLALTNQNIWLAHVLDRIIYRCQNSINVYLNHKKHCFTENLDTLVEFINESSVRTLQTSLTKLEELGLIERQATVYKIGKRCHLSLTERTLAVLPELTKTEEAANDRYIFCQAENIRRFDALVKLCGDKDGRRAVYLAYLLDRLVYRTQNSKFTTDNGDRYFVLKLERLAEFCSLSPSTFQRRIAELEKLGLVVKTRKKVTACKVETRYSIPKSVWQALREADSMTENIRKIHEICQRGKSSESPENSGNDGNLSINRTGEESDVATHEENDQPNIDKKKSHKNKVNSTSNDEKLNNVSRRTCSHNEQTSNVDFKNADNRFFSNSGHTTTPPTTGSGEVASLQPNKPSLEASPIGNKLNYRQIAYVKGMLDNVNEKRKSRGIDQLGNVDDLYEEVAFSLSSPYFMKDKTSFFHRVNAIAKMLMKPYRWCIPYGFEKYTEYGKNRKKKRQDREQAYEQEKQRLQEERNEQRRAKKPVQFGKISPFSAEGEGSKEKKPTVPQEILIHIEAMKKLEKRYKLANSEAEKAQIEREFMEHNRKIKQQQAMM